MSIIISIKTNAQDIAAAFMLEAKDMQDALRISLNKMAEQSKVAAAREVVKAGYKLKVSTIKAGIRIERASAGNLKATLVATGKPIPLIAYGAKWGGPKSAGVRVNVKTAGKMINGAFIATMPNGKKGVFVRMPGGKHIKTMKGGKASYHQLPIRQLYGPSIPDMVWNDTVQKALIDLYLEKFPALLRHEKWRLSMKINVPRYRTL